MSKELHDLLAEMVKLYQERQCFLSVHAERLCALLPAQTKAEAQQVPAEIEPVNDTDCAYAYANGWNACRTAMLAASPQAKAEPLTWQPIETAPKDRPILLLVNGEVLPGLWHETPFREIRDSDGFYVGQHDAQAFWCAYVMGECEPTHWMPLPAPPAATTKEAKP